MRIAVIGATGGTGRRIVQRAAADGHQVIALARRPEAYEAPPGVTVRKADVRDPASLAGALDGADLVISALGPDQGDKATTVYSQGTANIVAAMRAAGADRIVVLSAAPVGEPPRGAPFLRFVVYPLLWRAFGGAYEDLRLMERDLRAQPDLRWTVVRPPRLNDDDRSKPVRVAVDAPLPKPSVISRADLAAELLRIGADDTTAGRVLTVSY